MRSTAASARQAGAWVLVVPVAVALGWFLAWAFRPDRLEFRFVPFVVLAAAILAVAWREHLAGRLSLLSPFGVTILAFALWFSAMPLFDVARNVPLLHHSSWWFASWLIVLAFAALYAGHRLGNAAVTRDRPAPGRHWSVRRAAVVSAVLMAVALASAAVLFRRVGGVGGYLAQFSTRSLFFRQHIWLWAALNMALPALLVRAGSWAEGPTARRGFRLLVAWLPAALVCAGFIGARNRALGLVVALVAIVHLRVRRIPRWGLAAMGVALAGLFVLYAVQRNSIGTQVARPDLDRATLERYLAGHDLGQFREFVRTVDHVPGRLELQGGRTFLSVVPSTPFPTGGELYSEAAYPDVFATGTSFTPTLPGELYMNFGWPGIVGGMALFGFLLGALEAWRRRNPRRTGPLLVYAYSIVPAALILRGDFTSMAGSYLAGLIPLLAAVAFAELRTPGAHAHGGRPEGSQRWHDAGVAAA